MKLGFSHIIRLYLSKNFINIFQNYKYPDIYKNKGILFEKEILKIKEGKKKY